MADTRENNRSAISRHGTQKKTKSLIREPFTHPMQCSRCVTDIM